MRPNVWQRMDSDLVPEFMADNDVEASRMFDWSPVNEPSTRPGVVPGYGNGAAKSSTSSNAISTAYDITTVCTDLSSVSEKLTQSFVDIFRTC